MPTALIGLGSNLGDRAALLERAAELLGQHANVKIVASSRPFVTAPVGGPAGQGEFLNAAVRLLTTLSPQSLLAVLQQIENKLGRARGERWSARTIDLDLLLYDDLVLDTPALQVPHPRMSLRRFVLTPAAEVAPEMIHPTTGWPIRRLLEHLNTAPNYIAIAGPVAAGKTQLASEIARRTGARLILDDIDPQLLARFNADPAATAWELETTLLQRRAQLLAEWFSSASAEANTGVVVSDFWFDQPLAYARQSLSEPQQAQIAQLLQQLRQQVPSPKLLVMLDSLPDQRKLPDQGPVLALNSQDRQRAVDELSAAIQAMQ
jgi:2-amino-4-hydroxy-6-hydroxymethyldihydropteridine diphosphokinase